jgi:hypothetical protein
MHHSACPGKIYDHEREGNDDEKDDDDKTR